MEDSRLTLCEFSRVRRRSTRRASRQPAFASSGSRSRLETTTPPGFSMVTANSVGLAIRSLGVIGTTTSGR